MLLGIYPNKWKTFIPTETCTWMFIEAVFKIAQSWRRPQSPSVDKWIKCGTSRQWDIIQCQKEMLWSYEETWRKCKCISERSRSEMATDCMIPTLWLLGKDKIMKIVKRSGVGGRHGWIGGAQGIFRALKLFCIINTTMVDVSSYICQNP